MSSYFTLPSFARAKKNQEDLEKTNPQTPILKDEDEKFLEKQMSEGEKAPKADEVEPTKISDDGEEKPVTAEDQQKAGADEEQVAIPETQPEAVDGAAESQPAKQETVRPKSTKKNKGFELPSQEDAEKATQNATGQAGDQSQGEKRTWASYLPTIKKSDSPSKEPSAEGKTDSAEQKAGSEGDQRTWAQYASAYVPSSMPSLPTSMPSLPASWKSKDARAEPVYNEDGTINEEKTKEKQKNEVSVLLDKLDMSSFNNRVFAMSGETQKIYDQFALILKDTMNGGPTAYEDMEKLMNEAGPQIEKQLQSMPPFVQTLVKSLPAKLGSTMGPELLAAASEKPGNDMKTQLNAASKKSSGSGTTTPTKSKSVDKPKRKVPGLKGLISQEGAIAGMLRNSVSFLKYRFPFLASTTNVVMSLSVFILMFSFYYCHKRGKETRLAKAAESEKGGNESRIEEVDDDEDVEEDVSDEENEEEGEAGDSAEAPAEESTAEKLNKPEPEDVPMPAEKDDASAEKESASKAKEDVPMPGKEEAETKMEEASEKKAEAA